MSSVDLKKIDALHLSLANAHDRLILKIILDRKCWQGDIIKIAISFLSETSGLSKSSVLRSMKRIRNGIFPLLSLVQKHSARMEVSAVYRFNYLNLDRMVEHSKILRAKDREKAWILKQQNNNCGNQLEQPVNKPLLGVRETPTTGVRETPCILVHDIKTNTVGFEDSVDNLRKWGMTNTHPTQIDSQIQEGLLTFLKECKKSGIKAPGRYNQLLERIAA